MKTRFQKCLLTLSSIVKMALLQNLLWLPDIRMALLCVCLLLALRWLLGRPRNLPPGPWGFPVLGSLPAIIREIRRGVEPFDLFRKYAARYGPIFRLTVLNKTLVILNDFSSVKEAFQHPQLVDRPQMLIAKVTQSSGVTMSSGEPWVELRRFCLTVLRGLGVGKSSFEEKIGTEAQELLKEMVAFDGKPFDPKPFLGNAVANVICSVVFGKRYEYADQEFRKLLSLLGRNFRLYGSGGAILFFPCLRHLPFKLINEILLNIEDIRVFLTKIIDNHRATFDANNLSDFTDAYLMEIKNNLEKEQEAQHNHLSERNLTGTIGNLFVAGSETTATTLQWCLLYMLTYPDIQQRVQAEIDAVVGRNRLPSLADKPQLNFTQAVIWEVQRIAMIAPFGVMHAAASDTQFRGFLIPKGAFIVPNLWSISRDPKSWPEPDEFKPERFLNDEGEAVPAEKLIPFGIGRRSCIGEHLAKMELFIFFSYFMHQFTFKKPDNSPPLTLKGVSGLIYSPLAFTDKRNSEEV